MAILSAWSWHFWKIHRDRRRAVSIEPVAVPYPDGPGYCHSFESTASCQRHHSLRNHLWMAARPGWEELPASVCQLCPTSLPPHAIKQKSSQLSLWLPGLSAPSWEVRVPLGQPQEAACLCLGSKSWLFPTSPPPAALLFPGVSGYRTVDFISWWATEPKVWPINFN